ncbi:hypothetical protein GCM10011309_04430 [Litorimonas cladophorae]|uniref:DUF2330 domain-containing protein n=1 Tax=Litorimonas cladophorae TaxID=1220491 RepID=A0A918KC77_9PROT|nr:DUF2330 domain-containing protein [Litorimonas cladophorae]GGX58278.1 hypothetical protein GCM10011309_04430 [Litorimonas cladophorae]
MKLSHLLSSAFAFGFIATASSANAFCGFYVAKAGTDLFNESSKVALVRDGDRTVITMANDYQGDLTEFAMVIPVPTAIKREQVHISDPALLKHLDAYTAPRLVEYFDDDPCAPQVMYEAMRSSTDVVVMTGTRQRAKSLGVTIEDEFTVGEYDIQLLSATQSDGLMTYLDENGYQVPIGANRILGSYIKQDMKFFIAKVNLEEQSKTGNEYLRPIAVAFESPKFMLPIRLGTLNARGDQDLFVYALTREGQVETTNYRTQKIPTGQELPVYIKDNFPDFYKSMYATSAKRDGGHGVFMEYAWDMGWCDPCAADPLSREELQELGVFWLPDSQNKPMPRGRRIMPQAQNVFVTRLHVRYDAKSFPEDLKFKTTGNKENYQGRYVLRHAYEGEMKCEAATDYKIAVNKRKDEEVKALANLTSWDRAEIWSDIEEAGVGKKFTITYKGDDRGPTWWKDIWGDK